MGTVLHGSGAHERLLQVPPRRRPQEVQGEHCFLTGCLCEQQEGLDTAAVEKLLRERQARSTPLLSVGHKGGTGGGLGGVLCPGPPRQKKTKKQKNNKNIAEHQSVRTLLCM